MLPPSSIVRNFLLLNASSDEKKNASAAAAAAGKSKNDHSHNRSEEWVSEHDDLNMGNGGEVRSDRVLVCVILFLGVRGKY
jgi:hypothetical protein